MRGGVKAGLVALALVVQEPSVSLFAVGVVYSISGPIEWAWRRLAHRPLEQIPAPLPEESPQG